MHADSFKHDIHRETPRATSNDHHGRLNGESCFLTTKFSGHRKHSRKFRRRTSECRASGTLPTRLCRRIVWTFHISIDRDTSTIRFRMSSLRLPSSYQVSSVQNADITSKKLVHMIQLTGSRSCASPKDDSTPWNEYHSLVGCRADVRLQSGYHKQEGSCLGHNLCTGAYCKPVGTKPVCRNQAPGIPIEPPRRSGRRGDGPVCVT